MRDFDKAIEVQPSYGDYLWQRGLSLYYADEFEGLIPASIHHKHDSSPGHWSC